MGDLRVPDLNKVLVAGRLTRDPDLRYTDSGLAVCKLGVANTRYSKAKDGSRKEDTAFVDVTVFDRQAEWIGEKLRKGRPVLVEGRLSTSSWEDRETGQKRSKLEVIAQRVTPLDWDDDGPGGGGSGGGERRSSQDRPAPRRIEEPVPEDDIPF